MSTTDTISTSAGDCWGDSNGSFSNTGTYLGIGSNTASNYSMRAWIPFTVNLPKDLSIVSAELALVASENNSATTVKVKIGCDSADNPSAPTNATQLFARSLTTAYTTNNNVAAITSGTEYTFDVTTAVQEKLNSANWVSGNNMPVMIVNNGSTTNVGRAYASYEHASYAEPKLRITYIQGGQLIVWQSD